MVTNEKKIKNAKNLIRGYVIFSTVYTVLFIAAIIDTLVITPSEGIHIFSATMIVLYSFLGFFLFLLFFNIYRFNNPKMVRQKAIHDNDERNALIQEKTNTYTLQFVTFALIIGILLGIYFNIVEVFASSLILVILIIIAHIVIKSLVKRKL